MGQGTPSHEDRFGFHSRLDALANVAVRVGLDLAPGQELLLTTPLEAIPLARLITAYAYKAGASLVTTFYTDRVATRLRYELASENWFDVASTWLHEGIATAYQNGGARLMITGDDPFLLADLDPAKISRANRALAKAAQRGRSLVSGNAMNWTIVPYATQRWANAVFPEDDAEAAVAKLWTIVFEATRTDLPDPISAWATHNRELKERSDWLNQQNFQALRFIGPGTDLMVGLAQDHYWWGGKTQARNGRCGNTNIPTEEVFTTPHRDRVEGYVTSSKPLSYMGSIIDNIRVRFSNGKAIEARAGTGESVLLSILGTDDGANRLGEVALVPATSPLSRSGVLFLNTLLDENSASHIAFGQSFAKCMREAHSLKREELVSKGANQSSVHLDWMIGSTEMTVAGIKSGGPPLPIMRQGEWVVP
jgi:aminopeptidase